MVSRTQCQSRHAQAKVLLKTAPVRGRGKRDNDLPKSCYCCEVREVVPYQRLTGCGSPKSHVMDKTRIQSKRHQDRVGGRAWTLHAPDQAKRPGRNFIRLTAEVANSGHQKCFSGNVLVSKALSRGPQLSSWENRCARKL